MEFNNYDMLSASIGAEIINHISETHLVRRDTNRHLIRGRQGEISFVNGYAIKGVGLHLRQHGAHLRIDHFALGALHFPLQMQRVAELLQEERLERCVCFPCVFDTPTEVVGSIHDGEFPVHLYFVFGVIVG